MESLKRRARFYIPYIILGLALGACAAVAEFAMTVDSYIDEFVEVLNPEDQDVPVDVKEEELLEPMQLPLPGILLQ